MKTVTIPLTMRQFGWIIFSTIFVLLNYWTLTVYLQHQANFNVFYVMGFIDIMYATIAFACDGKDVNPVHWIGYCLQLKPNKQQSNGDVE